MNKKIVAILVWMLMIVPVVTVTATKNTSRNTEMVNTQSPTIPTINGEINGILGETYDYTIVAVDPQGDDVFYRIRWGDCSNMNWVGPFESGEEVTIEHAWCGVCCSPGKFTITVTAKDIHGSEGAGGTLEVFMVSKRPRLNIDLLFQYFLGHNANLFPILSKLLGF